MNYVIVSPVKNEEDNIGYTLQSVVNQTILPDKWIIVDDGSSDETCRIVEQYSLKYSWIQLIKLGTAKEERMGGSKVVNAFNTGYKLIKDMQWDIIVKLDGDLILPENYFEEIINVFNNNPKVGLAGGIIMNKYGNTYIQEGKINYHIRGAFKSYRRECFNDIGGFKPIWAWDGIDEMDAMFKGWETKCIDLKVKHLRPTTAAYDKKKQAFKTGYEAYRTRMSFIQFILRFFYMMKNKPYFLYSYNYLSGYAKAYHEKPEFLISEDLADFINNFHLKRIFRLVK